MVTPATHISISCPTPATPAFVKSQISPTQSGVPPPQQVPTAQTDIEISVKGDPHYEVERQRGRQATLGLHTAVAQTFIEETEFVSLGCFCGVSSALSASGLRKSAGPFDWVRTSAEGLIHCFNSDFVDFMTFSALKLMREPDNQGFLSARWGGSFWHHKPDDPKVREDFIRRIERMLGLGNVPSAKARMFVWAINSTRELDATLTLYQSIKRSLPQATIYLLVLIDFQEEKGPLHLKDGIENVIFYRIHRHVWDNPSPDIHKFDDPYSEAIAFAVHYWTGIEGSRAELKYFESIGELNACCQQFDGGSPAIDLFTPKPFTGFPISLRRTSLPSSPCPARSSQLSLVENSIRLAPDPHGLVTPDPHRLVTPLPEGQSQQKAQPQFASVRLPDDAKPGDVVFAHAFGRQVRLEVPIEVTSEKMLQLRLVNGAVTFAVAATMTAAAASGAFGVAHAPPSR